MSISRSTTTCRGYYDEQVWDPIDGYYYYNVHLRVLQAINYLASRPDVDPKRIVVVGGSQGGRLGIVAAGLDPRIAAVVSTIANSPNQPYLSWMAACNPDPARHDGKPNPPKVIKDGMDLVGPPELPNTPEGKAFPYYDPMNYAQDIHCPVLMSGGLVDGVSPPESVFAVYYRLGTKDKQLVVHPGLGHDWSAEFDRQAWRWLAEKLK